MKSLSTKLLHEIRATCCCCCCFSQIVWLIRMWPLNCRQQYFWCIYVLAVVIGNSKDIEPNWSFITFCEVCCNNSIELSCLFQIGQLFVSLSRSLSSFKLSAIRWTVKFAQLVQSAVHLMIKHNCNRMPHIQFTDKSMKWCAKVLMNQLYGITEFSEFSLQIDSVWFAFPLNWFLFFMKMERNISAHRLSKRIGKENVHATKKSTHKVVENIEMVIIFQAEIIPLATTIDMIYNLHKDIW